jgi:penicillin amidase
MNRFQVDGQIVLAGPEAQVTIVRDEKGMPYIHADSMRDATFAQGFAAAQDRLFHMQLMRLQAQGRLTELVGQDASDLDIRNRTIGMARAARKHAEILDDDTRSMFQSYVDGINAFLDHCPGDVPIEFGLAGIEPDRWAIEDSLSVLYLMAWDTSANLNHELVWQMLVDQVGTDRAEELLPININADDVSGTDEAQTATAESPANDSISRFPPPAPRLNLETDLKLQSLVETGSLRVGSNNWAARPQVSAGDHAMLAGDPHLDPRMLPGIMYAVGFILPDGRAVGAGVPGIPGFIVGRNEHVATAVTNSYGDVQDLYVETLDPENEGNYREGGQSIPFKIEKETLKIKDGSAPGGFRQQEIEIRFTSRGPVVSDVLAGLDADKVMTLRWAAVEAMEPHIGLMELLTAKSIDDVNAAIKSVTSIVLNFVFADSAGNVGWRVSGKVPIRSAGSGTMPVVVESEDEWQDNWQGWIPFDEMPHRQNPPRGWLGTANHYTVASDYPYYFTNYASPSYRYRRLKQRMEESSGELTVDDHWSIQRDTKNLMAEAVTPILIEALAADEQTESLAGVLREWDFHDDTDQSGPTVFQTVYTEFAKHVFQDELGDELAGRMLGNWYFWQERFENMVRSGDSSWFDDTSTEDITESMTDMIQRAGKSAVARLQPQLGSDPSQWLWGKVHTMQWVNPIRRSGAGMNWLGTDPIPANGSAETLYRGWYDFDDPYGVTHTAAVRMVVDFGDSDKVRAVMAGGETARTFHPHQKDQIDAYMSGAALHWWFSDEAIEEHAQTRLTLVPQS